MTYDRRTEIPPDWLERGVKRPDLSPHSIRADKWDVQDLDRMLVEMSTFAGARDALAEFTPTGAPAMSDTFWSLLKADPHLKPEEEVLPSHLVNRAVMDELNHLHETHRLRRFSVGDDVQAALSCASIEPDVETLFDKLQQEQKKADELEETLAQLAAAAGAADEAEADLDAMIEAMKAKGKGKGPGDGGDEESDGDGEGESDGEGMTDAEKEALEAAAQKAEDLRKKAEELKEQAGEQAADFEESMNDSQPTIARDLRAMMGQAADDAQVATETALAWGLDPGELQRMDPETRLEMARKLQSDRFRKIADRFGPMRNLMLSEQQRKTTHAKEEIVDVEIGNDLGRLLPSELLSLRHPLLKKNFYRKYIQRGLLQYRMMGTERLARGGIIFCEDGSGSMSGDREIFSKAVMLCLLDLARRQKRTMHVIHFGGPGAFSTYSFVKPSDFTFDRIVEVAEVFFFAGGTDFATPMQEALRILQTEFAATGGVKSDVVFMTDDECWVTEKFMEEYLGEMHRMQATTWGITATGRQPSPEGALSQMSEGKTATVADFMSGEDLRNVFKGV